MAVTKDRYVLQVETKKATAGLFTLKNAAKAFVGALAVREVVEFGKEIIAATATFQRLQNQLRLITRSTQELNETTALLRQTAVANRTSFEETVGLYSKLRITTDALGVSEDRVLKVTTKLSQALQVAGADTATANSVIRQFGQAMASGEVRGDEFRSIVEGLGAALAIMAKESGYNVAELRRMSQAGELTAEVMFKMFEDSTRLTASFEAMRPTLDQLKTAFDDAFGALKVKIGEASGLTARYENSLKSLTRLFNDWADVGAKGKLGDISDIIPQEVFDQAEKGLISLEQALFELRERLDPVGFDFLYRWFGDLDETQDELTELIKKLEELQKKQNKVAKEDKILIDQKDDEAKALQKLLQPYKEYIKKAKEFQDAQSDAHKKSPAGRIEAVTKVILELNKAYEATKGELEGFTELMAAANAELVSAEEALKKLNEKTKDTDALQTYAEFYKELTEDTKVFTNETAFLERALKNLQEDLKLGKISQEEFQYATRKAQEAIINQRDALTEGISMADYFDNIASTTQDAQKELRQLHMDPLQKQLDEIDHMMSNRLIVAVRELQQMKTGFNDALVDLKIDEITEATNKAIAQQKRIAEEVYKVQRSFAYGWKEAFDQYEDDATNAAKQAAKVFNKATKSMEDAIVNFAKTGKFEFRGLINDILEQLLRSQIKQLIAQAFGSIGIGGGANQASSLFGGFFANGGMLGAGKFGIAGENGPELITGPAQINPIGIGTSDAITYNINAVDASSFKQLVARDPGFIHAVASQGARKVPVRR